MKQEDKDAKKRMLEKIKLIRSSSNASYINETEEERKINIQRAKDDVVYCVQRYFPHYASSPTADFQVYFAKKVKKNQTIRAFAQWGRGLAKSVWCDIIIPFWLWINDETEYLVIIGSNETAAKLLLCDLQAEFEANPAIINDYGEQKLFGHWEAGNFKTKGGFIGKALGMGQRVRGLRIGSRRPDLIVCDDLEDKKSIKNQLSQDDIATWITTALLKTADGDKKRNIRRFLYANNKFYPRMIQTVLQEDHPKWFVHDVKAFDEVTYKPLAWKEKYPDDYYKEIIEEDGLLDAKAEYNNHPHIEGKIFLNAEIQWTQLPRIDHFETIVGHWDIAYAGTPKSDFNAVRLWGLKDKQFYYITGFVKKTKMRAALDFMCDFQRNLPEGVYIHWRFESQFWNDEVERTIDEAEDFHDVKLNLVEVDTPKGNKYDRILKLKSYYQNSRIWYNKKMKSHNDTSEGLAQLMGIEPNYKTHDDAPDADEQAIVYLSTFIYKNRTGNIRTGRVKRKHLY